MVDYVLKIDIDETDLVRKINSAVKKASSLGLGTGGMVGARGATGAGGSTFPKEMPPMSAGNMQKLAYIMEATKVKVRGRKEIIQFDFIKAQAKQVQRHSDSMERLGKLQNRSLSKMFTMGSIVKLAGLATGIAGLIQMRKMIIESSPMLQAMLKLLNVGIMFILRPIGDMFGFILRPLMIPFMKFAVSWYASSLKMIPVWTNMGNSILAVLTGNWDDAANYWNLAKAQMAEMSGIAKLTLNATKENSPGGVEVTEQEQENIDTLKQMFKLSIQEITGFINSGEKWDQNKSQISELIQEFYDKQNAEIREANRDADDPPLVALINWLMREKEPENKKYIQITEEEIRNSLAVESNTLKIDSNTSAIIALTQSLGTSTGTYQQAVDKWKDIPEITSNIYPPWHPCFAGNLDTTTQVASAEMPLAGGAVSSADPFANMSMQQKINAFWVLYEQEMQMSIDRIKQQEETRDPYKGDPNEVGDEGLKILAARERYDKENYTEMTILEKMEEQARIAQEKMDEMYGKTTDDTAKTGGFVIDRERLAELQIQIETAEAIYNATEEGTIEQRKAASALRELKLLAHRQIVAINEETGELSDLRNQNHIDLIQLSNVLSGGRLQQLAGITGGGGSSGSGPYDYGDTTGGPLAGTGTGTFGPGTSYPGGTGTRPVAPTSTSGDTEDAAGGGIIEEEIYGIGKCSGKRYRFGEAGEEAIIPLNDFNQMVGSLGRIGTSSHIGGINQQSKGVGKFTGISGGRYARFTRDLYNAQQAVGGAQGAVDDYGEFEGQKQQRIAQTRTICPSSRMSLWSGPKWGNTPEYKEYLEGYNPLKQSLTSAQEVEGAASEKLNPYSGMFSEAETIQQLEGKTDIESSKITNLGGINISIEGVSDPDAIVEQIGPKILKYLQENDARAGIR